MNDLVFYVLSSRKWKERQSGGELLSESGERDEAIPLLFADQVESACNELYAGRKGTLLLVIQASRLLAPLKKRSVDGKDVPVVEGPINLDAVIDKILLEPNEEGLFEVDIQS